MSSSTSSVMNQPQHQQQQQHMEESEHQHVWGNKTTASETGRNNRCGSSSKREKISNKLSSRWNNNQIE